MIKSVCAAACCAAVVLAAAPARAADEADPAIQAKVGVCGSCHGQDGVPTAPSIPIIWGQKENYLVKEIHDYRAGDRSNPVMTPFAKTIAQEDSRKIAAYFAAKSWPAASKTAAAGEPPQGIAMCKACHGQNFEGGAPAPRLAGLSYDYLLSAMNGFADGSRTNNLDMPGFMKALTEEQRESMAKYLAGL